MPTLEISKQTTHQTKWDAEQTHQQCQMDRGECEHMVHVGSKCAIVAQAPTRSLACKIIHWNIKPVHSNADPTKQTRKAIKKHETALHEAKNGDEPVESHSNVTKQAMRPNCTVYSRTELHIYEGLACGHNHSLRLQYSCEMGWYSQIQNCQESIFS